ELVALHSKCFRRFPEPVARPCFSSWPEAHRFFPRGDFAVPTRLVLRRSEPRERRITVQAEDFWRRKHDTIQPKSRNAAELLQWPTCSLLRKSVHASGVGFPCDGTETGIEPRRPYARPQPALSSAPAALRRCPSGSADAPRA